MIGLFPELLSACITLFQRYKLSGDCTCLIVIKSPGVILQGQFEGHGQVSYLSLRIGYHLAEGSSYLPG